MVITSYIDGKDYRIKGFWLVHEALQALPAVCPTIPVKRMEVYLDPFEKRLIAFDLFWDEIADKDPLWIMVDICYHSIKPEILMNSVRMALDYYIYNN